MIEPTVVFRETETAGQASTSSAPDHPGIVLLLLLSAWCGLVAGLLEVGTIALRKQLVDPDHLYKMSRHFVWLVPLTNAGLFLTLGLLGWGVILLWPHRGRWVFVRVLAALTLLPSILVAFPRIYSLAWLIVAVGLAMWLVPLIERHRVGFCRFVVVSFPAAVLIVAGMGVSLLVGDWMRQAREECACLAAAGLAEHPLDRDGHRRGGSPASVRL